MFRIKIGSNKQQKLKQRQCRDCSLFKMCLEMYIARKETINIAMIPCKHYSRPFWKFWLLK